MSGTISGLVHDLPSWVDGPRRSVLGALAELSDDKGNVVYQREPLYLHIIGNRAGCKERAARYAVKWLEAEDLVKVGRSKGARHPSTYHINIAKLRKLTLEGGMGESNAPIQTQKGASHAPNTAGMGESNAPIQTQKGALDSPIEGGIKEPYLDAVKVGDLGSGMASRASSPTPRQISQLSKQYAARRPATHGTINGAHSPPEQPVSNPTTLPPDFALTTEREAWATAQAREHDVQLNAQLAFKKFRLHFLRGNGKATELDDWEGRWERWILDDIEKLEQAQIAANKGRRHTNGATDRGRANGSGGQPARQGVRNDATSTTVGGDRSNRVGGLRAERLST